MREVDNYRDHAARCLLAAEDATDLTARSSLLIMASSWLRLAELAEKNSHNDCYYEPPPLRLPTSH
jgi:hypothetical protein